MSSVKISELSPITVINANTANTLLMGVDIPSGVTGKFTAHVLAQGLYSNEVLNVGGNPVTLPNTIAQFSLGGQSYIQTNLVNTNDGGSADIVVTANTGTDSTYFIDVGYVNKDYQPGAEFNNIGTAVNRLDGYIYAQGSTSNTWGGNLIVGSTTTGKEIRFIAGGGSIENVVARMNSTSIILNKPLIFADGTSQNSSSISAASFANAAFVTANSAASFANASFTQANSEPKGTSAGVFANAAFVTANSAASFANAAYIQANSAYASVNTALQNTSTITVNTNLNVPSTLVAGNTTINNGVSINGSGLYQYTTANNSTVTQLTSKSTSVTSNGRTGQITTSNASLAKGAAVSFTVNNNQVVSNKDVIIVNIASGGTLNSYQVCVDSISVGSFTICITNNGVGALAEALVINFAIIRVN